MQETLKYQAQKIMFDNSKDFNDMLGGKYMLYNLDIQQKLLDQLYKWKHRKRIVP